MDDFILDIRYHMAIHCSRDSFLSIDEQSFITIYNLSAFDVWYQ